MWMVNENAFSCDKNDYKINPTNKSMRNEEKQI